MKVRKVPPDKNTFRQYIPCRAEYARNFTFKNMQERQAHDNEWVTRNKWGDFFCYWVEDDRNGYYSG